MAGVGISLNIKGLEIDLDALEKYHQTKIETQDEFCDELQSVLDRHIASLVWDEEYSGDNMVLGINKKTHRPYIESEDNLEGCDIYNIADYLPAFSIDYEDHYWEFVDVAPLKALAEKYIKVEKFNDTRHEQISALQKITSNEFRRFFHEVFNEYLEDVNNSARAITKPVPVFQIAKKKGKRFFGVDSYTLKPVIGILESMDSCDVYDIDEICKCFEKDDRGYYVTTGTYNDKFVLKDKSVLNALVSRYFSNKESENPYLVLKQTTLDYVLDSDEEFVRVYVPKYDLWSYRTLVGKYYDYVRYPNTFGFIPKALYDYIEEFKQLDKDIRKKMDSADRSLETARKRKAEKKFEQAINIYLRVLELDLGYDVYHDLMVCYKRLKDEDNWAGIVREAYAKYPDNIEYQKAYLGLTGQKETPVLKESSYEQVASRIYGDEYQKEIRKLREYTFSIDDHPFYDLFFTELSERKRRAEDKKYQAYLAGIREIQGYFSNEIREGSRLEGLGKLESAIELYERLVAEKCYRTTPYERLTIIYTKIKREDDLRRILNSGISFFETLEKQQYEYVTSLAEKYNAQQAMKEILKDKGVIKYWFGNIVLYQQYPIVDKLKKRLEKLNK